jgi:hypothetical protein
MKTMEHDNDNAWGAAGGVIISITSYLLTVDWTKFIEQSGMELIKVALLGTVGGVAGLFGKKLAEKYLFKKKKKS